jgi:tryptophanyl-tRNA synthetase
MNQQYNIDDLFVSVTDIYAQYDEGQISYEEAKEILVRCCEEFIKPNLSQREINS